MSSWLKWSRVFGTEKTKMVENALGTPLVFERNPCADDWVGNTWFVFCSFNIYVIHTHTHNEVDTPVDNIFVTSLILYVCNRFAFRLFINHCCVLFITKRLMCLGPNRMFCTASDTVLSFYKSKIPIAYTICSS